MAAKDEQHMYSLPYDRMPMESNNYNDLINKPEINGHELLGNQTAAELGIIIPTKTSELTNDAGFVTSAQVPTKTSDLTNDSDFATTTYVDNKVSSIAGATIIKDFLNTTAFTSTFDNFASNLSTALSTLKSSLNSDEFIEIKSLSINTIGNLIPLNTPIIDGDTTIANLLIDWQGVSYANNVLKAIDITNKKVLSLAMTNDTNNSDFCISYLNDTGTYNFTIYYTKYAVIES